MLSNTGRVFLEPYQVVCANGYSTESKLQILKRWEFDALALQVADDEGFPARETGSQLDAVLEALHRLMLDQTENTGLSNARHKPLVKRATNCTMQAFIDNGAGEVGLAASVGQGHLRKDHALRGDVLGMRAVAES